MKAAKGKGGGKGKKSNIGDQQSISKYFKPKDEVAEFEDVDDADDGEVNEVEEVEDVEEIAEVGEVGRSFVGKCPLCDEGFADMDQLSTHASNCQDTAWLDVVESFKGRLPCETYRTPRTRCARSKEI